MAEEESEFLLEVLGAAAVGIVGLATGIVREQEKKERNESPKKKKRLWARNWVLRRNPLDLIYSEFSREDPKKFYQCFRMSPAMFDKLLSMVFHHILKKDTVRESIKPELRLMVTLRFLASGCAFGNLEDSFKIPKSTISMIVSETCSVLWSVLSSQYVRCPETEAEWLSIARGFQVTLSYIKYVLYHAYPKSRK